MSTEVGNLSVHWTISARKGGGVLRPPPAEVGNKGLVSTIMMGYGIQSQGRARASGKLLKLKDMT